MMECGGENRGKNVHDVLGFMFRPQNYIVLVLINMVEMPITMTMCEYECNAISLTV